MKSNIYQHKEDLPDLQPLKWLSRSIYMTGSTVTGKL